MTDDQGLSLLWAVGALALVGSALFARRIGFGEIVRLTLIWLAIFAVFIIGFAYKAEFISVWNRVTSELLGENDQQVAGDTLRIRQSEDGHFWVKAMVNDTEVDFLIDSGATTTAMSVPTAKSAMAEISENGFPVIINTANGTVEAQRGSIQKLSIGPISAKDLPIVVAEEFGGTNVIGMNFLSRLDSWRVEGNEMILEPRKR